MLIGGSRFIKDSPGPTVAAITGESTVITLVLFSTSASATGNSDGLSYSAKNTPILVRLSVKLKIDGGRLINAVCKGARVAGTSNPSEVSGSGSPFKRNTTGNHTHPCITIWSWCSPLSSNEEKLLPLT